MIDPKKFLNSKDIVQLDMTRVIDEAWSVFKDSSAKGKKTLKLETIATHSGKIINRRMYPGKHVKAGASTFFKDENGAPYNKPFCKDHNTDSDSIIGRVQSAEYKHLTQDAAWNQDYLTPTKDGSGFLQVTSHITDEEAIEKFLDGRWATVSVSGDTDRAHCSTCTKKHGKLVDFRSEFEDSEGKVHQCEHNPGTVYEIADGVSESNYIITGNLFYDELSQITVPADDGAVHLSKMLIEDSAKGTESIFKNFELGSTVETLISQPRFAILDAEGNEINGLGIDTYKSTKTYSLPSEPKKIKDKKTSTSSSAKGISEESFAKAVILDHFSKAGSLELTDAEQGEVEALNKADLSETQKNILDEKGFFVNQHLSFRVHSSEIANAYREVADRLTFLKDDKDKSAFMSAVAEQMKAENIELKDSNNNSTKGEKMLTPEQEKDLLQKVEDFEAKVKDLEQKLETSEGELNELKSKQVADKAAKVVALRKELGFHDAAEVEGEELAKLVEDYSKKEIAFLDFMVEDLSKQKEAKGKFSDEEELDPVEDPTKVEDKKIEEPADSKKVEDKKAKHFTDLM